MNKDTWSYFKHLGRLLGKIYLILTPRKTDEEVPSQQGAPSTFNLQPDLLGSFPPEVQNSNSALQWGGKGFDRKLGVA